MNIVVEILDVQVPALFIVWGFGALFLIALAVGIHFDNKKEGN
jgi:hypothetical protein